MSAPQWAVIGLAVLNLISSCGLYWCVRQPRRPLHQHRWAETRRDKPRAVTTWAGGHYLATTSTRFLYQCEVCGAHRVDDLEGAW